MRTMRLVPERPPGVRYWYQKVREPPGRTLTANPVTELSQIMVWPAVGTRASFTAISVSFRVMARHAPPEGTPKARAVIDLVWRAMEQYGEICRKIKATWVLVPCFIWRAMAAQGAGRSLHTGEAARSIPAAPT